MQDLFFTNEVEPTLNRILAPYAHRIAVIVDDNTRRLVLPALQQCEHLAQAPVITIGAGDVNKNIDTVVDVWQSLQQCGATRHWMVVNLGGGVVTDLGGFAAATFKRGIKFVNVPTTLLSAVDAAVGGKTGVNFGDLKNEIGCFQEASAVIISTRFLSTLPIEEIKSGFAEMLKHGLLSGKKEFDDLLKFDFNAIDYDVLLNLLHTSVLVKERIVKEDPHEQGIRRALNLGHTAGHAFESLAMQRNKPIPHGYAVAWGMVVETVLSHTTHQFSSNELHRLADFVKSHYGAFYITCDDYPELLRLMHHDKKSQQGEINCTLLAAPGDIKIDQTINDDDMKVALDIYRDLLGI